MHIAFTSTGWVWSCIRAGSGALTTVKIAAYENYTPGTARQRVSITIDRAASNAWVRGADGVTTEVSHPTIGSIPSPFVRFEVYYREAHTDKRAYVLNVRADSR